ncbi:hypothetical protein J132_09547 [Termitomyces sp. J132]|nr:hypothetical protein J132_09547 [Termitomyces sp. J132]
MTRRSARLASAPSKVPIGGPTVTVDDQRDFTEPDHEDCDEEILKPKKKRQKQSKKPSSTVGREFKNVRGRRGALKAIVEMPLDILHEIFMHLTPLEVLHLSRMCKALRRILMVKSAEFIWKQARFNLDNFPHCPEDLNEVQFACLMFDNHCDYCSEQKARYFIWSIRRRCCKKCITDRNGLESLGNLPQFFSDTLRSIVPSLDASGTEDIWSYLDRDAVTCIVSATKLHDEFLNLEGEAQENWRRDKAKERQRRINHGRLCEDWIARQTKIRASRLNDARMRRCEAIKQRLIDLGWGEELEFIRDFKQWPAVKQPKDLTERIWRNIKDDLIKSLKEHKASRLEEEYLDAQEDRRLCLSICLSELRFSIPLSERILPPIADFRQMEPFSTLIMAPATEKVEFSASMLQEATKKWRSSKDIELRHMVVSGSSLTSGPTDVDILSLAATFFKCWRSHCCNMQTISYPEVLVHGCCMSAYGPGHHNDNAWNYDGERVSFDKKAHSLAKTILEASGLDYNITTQEQVHQPNFYIECHKCPSTDHSNGKRILLTWHSSGKKIHMARANLSDSEVKLVKELEIEELRSATGYADYTYHVSCKHGQSGKLIYLTDYDLAITQTGFRRQPGGALILKLS